MTEPANLLGNTAIPSMSSVLRDADLPCERVIYAGFLLLQSSGFSSLSSVPLHLRYSRNEISAVIQLGRDYYLH
jgi:hypothetical protein